eukprot:403354925
MLYQNHSQSFDVEDLYSQEKTLILSLVALLVTTDDAYEDMKLGVTNVLLKKLNIKFVDANLSNKEKEYLAKTIIFALSQNDDPHLRQNITQLIANLLLPLQSKKSTDVSRGSQSKSGNGSKGDVTIDKTSEVLSEMLKFSNLDDQSADNSQILLGIDTRNESTNSNERRSREQKRSLLQLLFQQMACEMHATDERKAEIVLDSLEQILNIAKSSNNSYLIVENIQEQDFLLEYLLESLTFLISNRTSKNLVQLAMQVTTYLIKQASLKSSISCLLSNLLEVLFKIVPSENEEIILSGVLCITEIFTKEPYLVIKAYESGFDFQLFFNAVKSADPEMALAGIEFWQKFIMIDTVIYKQDFKKQLFEQLLPMMLDQCKLKNEDYEKFMRDKRQANVLERKRQITRKTIRSKAAQTIEIISEKFQKEVFTSLKSQLESYINSKSNWVDKEAAILVLGVISGFKTEFKQIEAQLLKLVPLLIEELSGTNAQVKATTCWTLSTHSFTEWLTTQENQLFFHYVDRLLLLLSDEEKSVQKSALSNFQQLLQTPNVKNKLAPRLNLFIDAFTKAFGNADHYTMMSLNDAIYHSCLCFGDKASDLAYQVMPYLVQSFQITSDEQSNSIYSLIDCLIQVTSVLQGRVSQWAGELIERSHLIIITILKNKTQLIGDHQQQNLNISFTALKDQDNEIAVIQKIIELVQNVLKRYGETEKSVTGSNQQHQFQSQHQSQYASSLMGFPPINSSIAQKNADMQLLVQDTKVIDFFITCFKSNYLIVVQDALANFIEILPKMPDHVVAKRLDELVFLLQDKLKVAMIQQELEQEEDFNRVLVCNNSCWALGELTQNHKETMKRYSTSIIQTLSDILNQDLLTQLSLKNEEILKHFSKTISITLGRLGLLNPEEASQYLPSIIKPWCVALRYMNASDEKVQAFKGLCGMIPFNPIGIAESFPYFCEALVEFNNPPQDLENIFQNLIITYKHCLGEQEWTTYIQSFPPQLRQELSYRFRLIPAGDSHNQQ